MVFEVIFMKDEKKNPQEESQNKKLRKLTRKRWFYPALYLVVVALIVSAVLWSQSGMNDPKADNNKNEDNVALNQDDNDAVPVVGADEVFKWPVADENAVEVVTPFYDVNGDPEDQQKALVTFNNTTSQNTGVCIAAKDGKAFDVEASMSGKVVKAEKDPTLGYVVVIEHEDGVKTMYESLASVKVKKGEQVSQGQVLGTAGKSQYNVAAGTHVHFEIRKDDRPVNPVSYFQKGLASLENVKGTGNDAQVTSGTPQPSDPTYEEDNSDSTVNSDTTDEDLTEDSGDQGTTSDQPSDNQSVDNDNSSDMD
mgnify:CR=1 FL=1